MLSEPIGKIIAKPVYNLIQYNWYSKQYVIYLHLLNKCNTYISVFGPYQDRLLHFFKTNSEIKILFESRKAINTNYNRDKNPRNTVVVYELADYEEK